MNCKHGRNPFSCHACAVDAAAQLNVAVESNNEVLRCPHGFVIKSSCQVCSSTITTEQLAKDLEVKYMQSTRINEYVGSDLGQALATARLALAAEAILKQLQQQKLESIPVDIPFVNNSKNVPPATQRPGRPVHKI